MAQPLRLYHLFFDHPHRTIDATDEPILGLPQTRWGAHTVMGD
jgi:hypothetical protein